MTHFSSYLKNNKVLVSLMVVVFFFCSFGAFLLSKDGGSWLKASLLTTSTENVTLMTSLGSIEIELYRNAAPNTVNNFVRLAKMGRFDKMPFHESVSGLFIQSGDYENGDGTGGQSIWKEPFADEFVKKLSHKRGVVSMANRGLDTNQSQFFILLDDRTYLDGRHTIFGRVVRGLDVADKISQQEVDHLNQVLNPLEIEDVVF